MLLAVFSMILAMVSITGGASIAKSIFPAIGAEMTTALRLAFAAIILAVVFRPFKKIPDGKQLKYTIYYGASLGLMNLFFYLSIERIHLGVALALEFMGPLLVAMLGTRNWQDFIWVILASAGLVLLLPVTEFSPDIDVIGVVFALIAGFFWALYIVTGKKLAKKGMQNEVRGGILVSWGMMVAAAVVAPVGLFTLDLSVPHLGHILALAFVVGLLSSAIPYSLEMVALRKLPAKTFGILTSLEPAVGAISGFLYLNEVLSLVHIVAIGCIMLSSIGSTYFENKRTLAEPLIN